MSDLKLKTRKKLKEMGLVTRISHRGDGEYYNCTEVATFFEKITTENEKLKRIVEVLEQSNNLYAEYGNDNPDSIYNFETARQAKEEVERIRGEGK